MSNITHLDLFSGIGGFIEAARRAGIDTVGACEIDSKCREYIENRYGVACHDDIKTIHFSSYKGVTLITGGPPCQPASCAGKRKGAEDNRWLWPEAIRAVREVRPDAFIFENPAGIRTMGLDGICSELEDIGYEVQPFNIPASGVNAPHLRRRYWIIGFATNSNRLDRRSEPYSNSERHKTRAEPERCCDSDAACERSNTDSERLEGQSRDVIAVRDKEQTRLSTKTDVRFMDYQLVPRWTGKEIVISRVAPEFSGVDAGPGDKGIITALGNMICIPVAVELMSAISSALNEGESDD